MRIRNSKWSYVEKSFFLVATVIIVLFFASLNAYAAIDESEPNNSKVEANQFTMGETVYGEISEGGWGYGDWEDPDWFRFTAPVNGTVRLTLWQDNCEYEDGRAIAHIYDSDKVYIDEISDMYISSSGTAVSFDVKSGETYFIDIGSTWIGDYHFVVKYVIGKTSINSVKGKKKAISVKWRRKNKIDFYQVQYVKKSDYDDYGWKKAKIIKVSNKTNRKTISKLSRKKKYVVRIRVARKIEGTTYYSGWSAKKVGKTL